MKLYLILILLCTTSFNSLSQSWEVNWENKLGNRGMDYFADVIEGNNQEYTVLGSTKVTGNANDYWLIRYDEKGDTVWTKTLGTTYKEIPKKMVQLANGDLLLMGTSVQENANNVFLIRTDNSGNELWRKIFDDGIYYSAEDVVSLEDNGFVLAGAKGADAENVNMWMANVDPDGKILWEKTFESNLKGCIKTIKKLPTEGFVIAGQVNETGKSDCDIQIMRTDINGELLFSNRIKSPNIKEWPECVCCSPDSCFVMVGWKGKCLNDINSAEPIFDFDLTLNKIDCNGKVLWTKNFDSEGSEGGNAVVIRPDGHFLVAGIKATSFLGKVGPWLLHIDTEGNIISENLIKFHFNNDQAIKIINCSDGGFMVIGPGIQEDSNSRSDGWIMKFASL